MGWLASPIGRRDSLGIHRAIVVAERASSGHYRYERDSSGNIYQYERSVNGNVVNYVPVDAFVPVRDANGKYETEASGNVRTVVRQHKLDADGTHIRDADGANEYVYEYVYEYLPLLDEDGNHRYEADPRSLVSTNCRDASDDGYWLDSVEASLGHASFAAGPGHKVDGWQHIRPNRPLGG